MKKSLLFMAFLFILGGLSVNAADVVLDLSTNTDSWMPAGSNLSLVEKTSPNGLAVEFSKDAYANSGYVMVKTNAYITVVPNIECEKIILHNSGGCSTSAKLKVTTDAGMSVENALSKTNSDYEYVVPSSSQSKGTKYVFTTTNKNSQITKITFVEVSSQEPSEPVAYEPNFADVELWEGNSLTLDLGAKHPDVVFVSNNESVATVSAEGVITGVGIGETIITAMWNATEEFLEGETEFNVSVVAAPEGFFDILTIDKFSDASSSYGNVSYTSPVTGIKYEGNMMKSNAANGECIQLRWNADDATKRAGIFNTENPNGLVLASVSIEWNPTTSNNNVINVYSADKALSIADMLNAETVEQFTKDASCMAAHDIVAPAAYFGLRSNKNAHYIKSITLFWVKADVPAIEFPSFGEAEHSFTTESSEIRIADADHAFDIFYLHTPAQGNPEAYAEGETADSFDNKAEFDEANGEHVIPVSESGTLSYYAVHTATGTQGATQTVKVTKTATTAIDAIGTDAAESEAEYFDIRGVKVNIDNAAPGLYIRRQGVTATKVIVK